MSVKVSLSEEEQIQIKTIEGVIEDISGMNPEYIIEFLQNQIEIIKNGI
jgi:predicted metallopeptidase